MHKKVGRGLVIDMMRCAVSKKTSYEALAKVELVCEIVDCGSPRREILCNSQSNNGVHTDKWVALFRSSSMSICKDVPLDKLASSGVKRRVGSVSRARNSSTIRSRLSLAALAFDSGASLCRRAGNPCSKDGSGRPNSASSSDKNLAVLEMSAARSFKSERSILRQKVRGCWTVYAQCFNKGQ